MQKPPEIIIHNCIIHEQHLYHVMECIIGTITSITLSKEKSKHIFRKFVRFYIDKRLFTVYSLSMKQTAVRERSFESGAVLIQLYVNLYSLLFRR